MICSFCGESYEVDSVGFKAYCSSCGHYLHSCVQCHLFEKTTGRCRSHTTESVRDLEGMNYCEEFVPRRERGPVEKDTGNSAAADRFNNLFKN